MLKSTLQPYNNFKFNSIVDEFDLSQFNDIPGEIEVVNETMESKPAIKTNIEGYSIVGDNIKRLRSQIEKVQDGRNSSIKSLTEKRKADKIKEIADKITKNVDQIAIIKDPTEIEVLLTQNQKLEEMKAKAAETTKFYDSETASTANKIKTRINTFEQQYIGSAEQLHDSKLRLDQFVQPNLESGNLSIQNNDLELVFKLYGVDADEKFLQWKSLYSENQDKYIIKSEENILIDLLKANFEEAIQNNSTLANALRSVILRLSGNEVLEEGEKSQFGLSKFKTEKLLDKVNKNLNEGLEYLLENCEGECVYNLNNDVGEKIQIDKLLDEQTAFEVAFDMVVKQNANSKIADSHTKLGQDWDYQIQPRIDKTKSEMI
jgi:hypothetical protein